MMKSKTEWMPMRYGYGGERGYVYSELTKAMLFLNSADVRWVNCEGKKRSRFTLLDSKSKIIGDPD